MADNNDKSLQDIMSGDLFASSKGETVETLKFMEGHAVPLNSYQVAGMAYLQYLDTRIKATRFKPFINAIKHDTKHMAKPGIFIEVINALTMADRIKGSVRLNNVFGKGDK